MDGASPQGDEETGGDHPAQVDDGVMGEEVEVGGHGQQTHRPPPKASHVQVEAPEGLADVGADGGVHESGEDRHPADAYRSRVRIGPGAGVYLEHLQRQPDEVEGADDAELAPGLLLQGHEGDLHHDDVDQQGVVAGDRRIRMAPDQGADREPDEDGDGEGTAGQLQEGELDQAAGEQTPSAQRKARGFRHDRSMPYLHGPTDGRGHSPPRPVTLPRSQRRFARRGTGIRSPDGIERPRPERHAPGRAECPRRGRT